MTKTTGIMTTVVKLADNKANGCDSYFVKIDENVGTKLFMSELMRNRNFDRHKEFAPIAPKVGGKVDCKFNGRKMWGFTVEVCHVRGEISRDDWSKGQQDVWNWIDQSGLKNRVHDLHDGNVGRTKDGRPVVIDFSRFEDEDGFRYQSLQGIAYANINGRIQKIDIDEWK